MSRPVVDADHGTMTRWRKEAKAGVGPCPQCKAVARASGSGSDRVTGRLLVQCWCRIDELLVDPEVVKAGATRSCGRPGCEEQAA